MNFAVGYQQLNNNEFSSIVSEHLNKVKEVYFAWIGMASGRPVSGLFDWEAQQILEEELRELRGMNVKLDLLLNANCYGERAISMSLEKEILSIVDHLAHIGCLPEIVTTTSPFIARTIRKYCPQIEIRASINMRIGTIQAMSYVGELFDSFYLQRDLQRDLKYVREVHDWCATNDKKLCLLANSGCLRFCPGQSFHDNLVAHSAQSEEMKNAPDWNPHVCWNLYQKRMNFAEILRSTWIRPEDIPCYDGLVEITKLATRQHSHPQIVIDAYTKGQFDGNLLELLEPGFSSIFFPNYISNVDFPNDWVKKVSCCGLSCRQCHYCDEVLEMVLKSYE